MALKDLSANDIAEIKKQLSEKISQASIAEQFDINQSDVSRIKNDKEYSKYPSFHMTGLSQKTISVLKTIAANKDMNLTTFMKIKIHEIIDTTPDKYKRALD